MGKKYKELSNRHIEFINNKKLYFVGTAVGEGNVNVSPKGGDTLRVIDSNTIVWLNLTGSGNETAAHVLKNPRMTIMFCAFEGPPLILRAYGNTKVLHQNDREWSEYINLFPQNPGFRQIFILNINLVQASCGMGVPYYNYAGDREDLTKWSDKKGAEGIEKYRIDKNQESIDGFETEIVKRSGISCIFD